MAYSEVLLDHFRNPRNAGELPGANAVAEASNPVCGDVLKLFARVEDGRLSEVRFLCRGCAAAIAAGSYLTERLTNAAMSEAAKLDAVSLSEGLGGLPPTSSHAAALAMDGLRMLLKAAGQPAAR